MGAHRADRRASAQRRPRPHPSRRPGTLVPTQSLSISPTLAGVGGGRPRRKISTPRDSVPLRPTRPGVRRLQRKRPILGGLLSAPILAGITAMALAGYGALAEDDQDLTSAAAKPTSRVAPATALGGSSADSSTERTRRPPVVSRGSGREASADQANDSLLTAAEKLVEARGVALDQLKKRAEAQSAKIARNLWVLPMSAVQITAEFGQYGLWSSYHTGIDFNGNSGDPIKAIARGVVSSVGWDGAYGNKTVVTLADGTEIWYAHQTATAVSLGEEVSAGQLIGYVGATGNVTGSHLHVEVRPGAGDPVDPRAAFAANGMPF